MTSRVEGACWRPVMEATRFMAAWTCRGGGVDRRARVRRATKVIVREYFTAFTVQGR
jgi:hypothetical protein